MVSMIEEPLELTVMAAPVLSSASFPMQPGPGLPMRWSRQFADRELLAKLRRDLGAELDREAFEVRARQCVGTDELLESLMGRRAARLVGRGRREARALLATLWERWLPSRASVEEVQRQIDEGYRLVGQAQQVEACRVWLTAWSMLQELGRRRQARSFESLELLLAGGHILEGWLATVLTELKDPMLREHHDLQAPARSLCQALQSASLDAPATLVSLARAVEGRLLFVCDGDEAADRHFAEWLEEAPGDAEAYLEWAIYSPTHDEAIELLDRGLAECSDPVARLRLQDLRNAILLDAGRSAEVVAVDRSAYAAAMQSPGPGDEPVVSFGPAEIEELRSKRKDVGRNDPCPCGSGTKFKKCCWSGG